MKVLVADDDTVSRRLTASLVARWGYDVVVAKDGVEASQILLAPDAPNLAVIDWMMPGMDGIELCRNIRENKPEPYTYLIMLTSNHGQEDVIKGLSAGADDYIVKPFDPTEFRVRIRVGQRIVLLQDRLISAREAFRELAMHDPLTRLWNRAAIFYNLENELSRGRRMKTPISLMMIDLDSFKPINDTYGHQVGDEALKIIAKTLRDSTRGYDVVGRYGGDEFVVVLPGCDEPDAVSRAESLRAAVAQTAIHTASARIHPSISVGVAVDQKCNADVFELVEAADMALLRAKQLGRNRVEVGSLEKLPTLTVESRSPAAGKNVCEFV